MKLIYYQKSNRSDRRVTELFTQDQEALPRSLVPQRSDQSQGAQRVQME